MSLFYRASRQTIRSCHMRTQNSYLFGKNPLNKKHLISSRYFSIRKEELETWNENVENKFENGKPTLEYAKCMRVSYSNFTNADILHLSSEGDPKARREALVRNIMATDEKSYDEARAVLSEIIATNKKYIQLHDVPYKVGLVVSLSAGMASVPLVFHYDAVLWCHDLFVSAEIPEPQDRESILEVGSWSWAWMEPVLGQISFVLLTLQFARGQLINLGLKPYGGFVKDWRAKKLIKLYPNYDPILLENFANTEF